MNIFLVNGITLILTGLIANFIKPWLACFILGILFLVILILFTKEKRYIKILKFLDLFKYDLFLNQRKKEKMRLRSDSMVVHLIIAVVLLMNAYFLFINHYSLPKIAFIITLFLAIVQLLMHWISNVLRHKAYDHDIYYNECMISSWVISIVGSALIVQVY